MEEKIAEGQKEIRENFDEDFAKIQAKFGKTPLARHLSNSQNYELDDDIEIGAAWALQQSLKKHLRIRRR